MERKTMINITLFNNQWISLHKIVDLTKGVKGYVYSHETRCDGKIVAVLPFRKTKQGVEYLLKSEMTPCWNINKHTLCTITGGIDTGYAKLDAVKEVKEETGYSIDYTELIDLGTSYASKSSDSIYELFSVDLTDKIQGEATGDGIGIEDGKSAWVRKGKIIACQDPFASVIYTRLQEHIKKYE